MFADFSAVVSDGLDGMMIENYYEEENRKCIRFMQLSKQQKRLVTQRDIDELLDIVVGVKRRFAVARLYRCVLDEWLQIGIGILFLCEVWDSAHFILMSLKEKNELWRCKLIGENGAVTPIEVKPASSWMSVECANGVYGLSFAELYNVQDFVKPLNPMLERIRQMIKNREKQKGLLKSISSFFKKVSDGQFRIQPPDPPEKRPKKKEPKVKKTGLVLSPEWRNYLINQVGMKEDELADERLVRKVINVVKVMDKKKTKDVEVKKRKMGEERRKEREEETEGEEDEIARKIVLPHEIKKKEDAVDKKLLIQREEEIERLQRIIKKISVTEKKRISLYKKKIRTLERTASVLKMKKRNEAKGAHHLHQEGEKGGRTRPPSGGKDDGSPSCSPPKPPPAKGFDLFLKKKEKRAKIRKQERESRLPPPPEDVEESGGLLKAIAAEIAERRISMMGFREDEEEEESEEDDSSGSDWEND